MNYPFASVQDIRDRTGEDITGDTDIAMAEVILRIVSSQVRFYGKQWTDPILSPDICSAITIEAASRAFLNPEGFQLERGDEVTFQRGNAFAVGSMLNAEEIRQLQAASGRGSLTSATMWRDFYVADGGIQDNTSIGAQ